MNIFLTGATGLVGGELLVQLSRREEVSKIYCLLRSKTAEAANERLQKVFAIHNDPYDATKIIPVLGNLFDDELTGELAEMEVLKDIEVIIHSAANTSFSRFNDAQVEAANIGGLTKILLWARQLAQLQTFLYIGTATICGKDVKDRVIYEDESPNLAASHVVKYTYTKMQGEILIREHLPEDKILIARPSIIMGDSRPVKPRSPVILWAVATMNQLRLLPMKEHVKLDVIPVDYAAMAIVSLLFSKKRRYSVYHISSGERAATSPHKLAQTLSTYFSEMPPFHFIQKVMVSEVKHWTRNRLHEGAELYGYREYLDYWKTTFNEKSTLRMLFTGLDPYLDFVELGHIFDNTRLLEDTGIENSEPADVYIEKSLHFVENLDVLEGALDY